jgi:hypothetical protein
LRSPPTPHGCCYRFSACCQAAHAIVSQWRTLTPEQRRLVHEVLRNHPVATARDVVDELKANGGI